MAKTNDTETGANVRAQQKPVCPGLNVLKYCGTADELISAGTVTAKMLHMEEWDNGFGITTDEFGNHVTVWADHGGPGIYLITRYVENAERATDEKDFCGRSIDDVDVMPMIDGLRGGAS